MAGIRRVAAVAAGWLLLATGASGYYHFVHYATRTSPFTPVYEKFDLTALPNKTIFYFISDPGPLQLTAGDSASAILSQIRAAAKVWNDVDSSDLRIAYGGTATPGLPQTSPGIDVTFEDLPPGIIAQGAPLRRAGISGFGPAAFVPIARSIVKFSLDFTRRPSYGDDFFLTAVHEFGHALGLQHTLASATMSTWVTRSTSKAHPLDTDDVAGISLLYPTASFKSSTGVISGRVLMGGQGVNLASVVAIPANGPAISALTNPDGTYRIEGIPSGSYYVYVHPLPLPDVGEVTPANINSQWDPDGNQSFPFPVGSGVSYETQFYPGVKDWQLAAVLPVTAGQSLDGVNFNLQRVSRMPLNAVYVYGYPGNYAVQPAYVNFNGGRQLLAVGGAGLIAGNAPAPGLSVSVLGGLATVPPGSPRAYTPDYILVDFQQTQPVPPDGPRHLVFSLNDEIYVLPAAFHAVRQQPPAISAILPAVDANGRPMLILTGDNLTASTRIWFDGQPAPLADSSAPVLTVVPPPAPAGYRAVLEALNTDGQTSMFLQAASPPVYQYDATVTSADQPSVSITPNVLTAGTEAMIDIGGSGTQFTAGMTLIGFGSSDVVVRRSWVVSPTRILANVSVASGAAPVSLTANMVTGLRSTALPFALQVQSQTARRLYLASTPLNLTWNNNSVIPGSTVVLLAPDLTAAQAQSGVTLTLNDVRVSSVAASAGQVAFTVPNLSPGPAVVRLLVGSDQAAIVVSIDPPPASIVSLTLNNFPVDSTRGIRAGDAVTALVVGFGDLANLTPARARVTIGGADQQVMQITQVSGSPTFHLVQFVVGQAPSGSQLLVVLMDGKPSVPSTVTMR